VAMDRRQALQAEVRRQQKKNVAVQQVMWVIFAILFVIGCVFGFFKLQDAMSSPLAAAKKYVNSQKSRAAMKAPDFQKQGDKFPSFYMPKITDNQVLKVVDKDGKDDPSFDPKTKTKFEDLKQGTAVQMQIVVEGEAVEGSEQKRTGQPTHRITQWWEKQRDGKINPKGKWMLRGEVVESLKAQ
jgi:hypothetical protein